MSLSCGHQCPSVCGENCPSQEFCHECGDEDVKARVADVILFQTYGEIDPSEDPVLVLQCCSTVYTMATLDGTLQMSRYYDSNGEPRGALPGDYIDTPQCPTCKKPIRGLRRYGRVTKRAAIDAAEKKFTMYAQTRLVALQERVHAATQRGNLTRDTDLQDDLRAFGSMVKTPPCKKVFEACVASLTKAGGGEGVEIDHSTLPVPNSNFRFFGYFNLFSAQLYLLGARAATTQAEVCTKVAVKLFVDGSYAQQASEARLVLVQVLLLRAEEALRKSVKAEEERKRREKAVKRITAEAQVMMGVLAASGAQSISDHAEEMVALNKRMVLIDQRARSATFYQAVSKEELRAIKTAMQAEFRGSGHWYRCVKGHSYSIGECGMAMERTCCPECGAPVGGANHAFVEGNVHDAAMDSL